MILIINWKRSTSFHFFTTSGLVHISNSRGGVVGLLSHVCVESWLFAAVCDGGRLQVTPLNV